MFLYNFDFFSPEITLYFHGKTRHSSILSSIISIIFSILMIVFIIILSLDFLLKKNPICFYYNKYVDDIGSVHLNNDELFHFVFFSNFNLNNYIENYLNIIGILQYEDFILENLNLSNYDFYVYEKCEIDDYKNIIKEMDDQSKNFFNYSFCIKSFYNKTLNKFIDKKDKKFNYPKIEHGASKITFVPYGIYFIKCQNNSILNKGNVCKSENVITEYVVNELASYGVGMINYEYDLTNYKNPINKNFLNIFNYFSLNTYPSNNFNFHITKLRTTSGIFFDTNSEIKTIKYDYNEKNTYLNPNIFGSINFWVQNTVHIYDRTYKKLQDIAGGVDGILEIIMLFIKLLNILILNDFQVINDFNREIEKNVKKNYYFLNSLTKNLDDSSKKISENFQKNIFEYKNNSNVKMNSFVLNNSKNIINSPEIKNNYKIKFNSYIKKSFTKLENNYQKISRLNILFSLRFNFKKNNYINYINKKRQKIISEEKLLKLHLSNKKLKEINKNNYNKFYINNFLDSLKETSIKKKKFVKYKN